MKGEEEGEDTAPQLRAAGKGAPQRPWLRRPGALAWEQAVPAAPASAPASAIFPRQTELACLWWNKTPPPPGTVPSQMPGLACLVPAGNSGVTASPPPVSPPRCSLVHLETPSCPTSPWPTAPLPALSLLMSKRPRDPPTCSCSPVLFPTNCEADAGWWRQKAAKF